MYNIEWQPKAYRQLVKIKDENIRVKIYDSVDNLRHWPTCQNVKKLQNRPEYRLRIGNWRVIFEVKQSLEIISIEEVKKRDEHTY